MQPQIRDIPQAASAHDTFWDFISLMPEAMHMIMWVMSDRALPRSLRTMEGFGIHTFRFVNEEGKASFVKLHWKPLLGMHSVLWDEAQEISGKDADFHRRDLWESIEASNFPEWEFGVQVVPEEDEHNFGFDLLDATKLIPEELVPVQRIGKMVLNRNVDNYFAETEQVAFHPGHLVPGIDFSNDPLLQGRLFSYVDTQLTRLGGPNFGPVKSSAGQAFPTDYSLLTASSVLFDAVLIADGDKSAAALSAQASAQHFINEAFKHCKAIGALGAGEALLKASAAGAYSADDSAVVTGSDAKGVAERFIAAAAQHRNWNRKHADDVPA